MRGRAIAAVLPGALFAMAAAFVLLAVSPPGAGGVLAATVAAGAGAGLAMRFGPHDLRWRAGWVLLAIALSALLASAALTATEAERGLTLGSIARLLALAGLVALISARREGRALEVALESAIAASGVAALLLTVPFGLEALPAPADPARWLLAEALLDLGVVWAAWRAFALRVVSFAASRYLLGSFALLIAADAASALLGLAGTAPPGWPLSVLSACAAGLLAAALLHPRLRGSELIPPTTHQVPLQQALVLSAMVAFGPAGAAARVLDGVPIDLVSAMVSLALMSTLVVAYLLRQVHRRATGEYAAQHDELTGLPSRALFQDRLEAAMAIARRQRSVGAVMFIDLDRFKDINDGLGHDVGDQVLQAIARRLNAKLREQDTLARLGGDEFAVLLPSVSSMSGAQHVAGKLLDSVSEPVVVDGRNLFVGMSIGIALFPAHGSDADTLLKHADTTMYQAKANGRGTFEVFTSAMGARAQVKQALQTSLHTAMERGEFLLHYQPRVDHLTGAVVSVEALARWDHPRLGFVPPRAFIPLAEESGLIVALGDWVLETACRQALAWKEQGTMNVPVSVNVSARQFVLSSVDEVVRDTLDRTGLPPDRLELEITESALQRDSDTIRASIETLRKLGVRCSLDDFGTGSAGFAALADFPVDTLKVGRSLVAAIDVASGEAPIVNAIIALARSLRLNLVAEGVETRAQAAFLGKLGCRYMQGYLFGRPAPPDALVLALASSWVTSAVDDAELPEEPDAAYGGLLSAACDEDIEIVLDPNVLQTVIAALRGEDPQPPAPPPPPAPASGPFGLAAAAPPPTGRAW